MNRIDELIINRDKAYELQLKCKKDALGSVVFGVVTFVTALAFEETWLRVIHSAIIASLCILAILAYKQSKEALKIAEGYEETIAGEKTP